MKMMQNPGFLKYFSRHGALLLSLMLTAGLSASSAAEKAETENPKHPVSSVLILTGVGMVPTSSGSTPYEEVFLQVANVCAKALNTALEEAGIDTQTHIIADKSESLEESVAKRLTKTPRDGILQVAVTHVKSDNENTVYLDFELMLIEFRRHNSGDRVAVMQEGLKKRYALLKFSGDDFREVSIPELAGKFVRDLQARGFIETVSK